MKSWGLWEPLLQRLRSVPMHELKEAELEDLLEALMNDRHVELLVRKGDGQELNLYMWVTPTVRMRL